MSERSQSPLIECPAGFSGAYTIPDGVTSIGNGFFSGCARLTSVTIPNSVTSIGRDAFSDCIALTSVTIPDSVTSFGNCAFSGCRALESVTIPVGVTSIGDRAFAGCSTLTSINVHPDNANYTSVDGVLFNKELTVLIKCPAGFSGTCNIPDSVTSISNGAFFNCRSISAVTLPDGVSSIGEATFFGCSALASVTVPDGCTSIGDEAFANCTSFAAVTIGNGVISIGYRAFCGCSALASVTIPASVTSIGNEAFLGCSALTSVTIPDSVTSFGNCAFSGCRALESVTIPDSVTRIGNAAFSKCNSLTCVIIGNSVNYISESAFCGCASLVSVTIPASVTTIGDEAFSDCFALTNINVHPDNANYTSVDGILFNKERTVLIQCPCCSAITSFAIPDGVTIIGDYAFYYCSALTSVTIPDSVISIGKAAFLGCAALTSVTIPARVTSIGDEAFLACSALTNINVHPNNMNYASVNGVLVKLEVFELTDEDVEAIEIAKNVARRFLKSPQITPKQVIALGNALYALDRLPIITPGVATEFGIEYRKGTTEYSEMRYIDFRISESEFEISKGGSVYDRARGSDSFSDPGWIVGIDGHGENECDLYNLEKSIDEYLNLGAKLSISDESEIKYE